MPAEPHPPTHNWTAALPATMTRTLARVERAAELLEHAQQHADGTDRLITAHARALAAQLSVFKAVMLATRPAKPVARPRRTSPLYPADLNNPPNPADATDQADQTQAPTGHLTKPATSASAAPAAYIPPSYDPDILAALPVELAWRESRERRLCHRPQDVHARQAFTDAAARHRLLGPAAVLIGQDAWPLDPADWPLAADIADRQAQHLPIPAAWQAEKLRRWCASGQTLGLPPHELDRLSTARAAAEQSWATELTAWLTTQSRPEDIPVVLQALALEP